MPTVSFDYRAPTSLEEVLELLSRFGDDAKPMAGGTALVQFLKRDLIRPRLVVDLGHLPQFSDIAVDHHAVRIGALCTHRELEWSPGVGRWLPALRDAERVVANPRIRNMATIGGNLCHADPNQDPPVALIALGASVRLRRQDSERSLPLEAFFTDYYETVRAPEELLVEITVPIPPPRTGSAFLKFTPRTADDFGTATAAVQIRLAEDGTCAAVRIAVGCVAPVPWRSQAAEALVVGHALTPEVVEAAAQQVAQEVQPMADIRGSERYKRAMTAVMVRRALRLAAERAAAA